MIRYTIIFSLFLSLNINAQMDTTSYSVGVVLAKNLKAQGMTELNIEAFNQAIKDVFSGEDLKISYQDASVNFKSYLEKLKMEVDAKVRKAGEDFLAENSKRPGVVTLSSGLQYEILETSDSAQKPSLSDKVKVHYHGTLIDGTVFDSSVERNEPISFPLNGVIQGWQEGLQLMPVGSKYRLYIPYSLAYGDRGAGDVIKPYSALIFDVSLLAIE